MLDNVNDVRDSSDVFAVEHTNPNLEHNNGIEHINEEHTSATMDSELTMDQIENEQLESHKTGNLGSEEPLVD